MDRHTLLNLAIAAAIAAVSFYAAPGNAAGTQAPPYANHTVGGNAGWFFNFTSNSSITNYTTWAESQTVYLGDFLIFNTNTNSTVVQTHNATTYNLCDASGDNGDETFVFTPQDNNRFGVKAVVAVPLTLEGANYFFSDAGEDGIQCERGMRFQIKVAHGRGLPPALSHPPPPPYTDVQVPPPPGNTPGNPQQQQQLYRDGAASCFASGIWRIILTAGILSVLFA